MSTNVIQHGNVAFGMGSKSAFTFGKSKQEQPTIIHQKQKTSGDVALWGDDNQYPQKFLEALRLNGSGGAGLRLLKATHYGQGFNLYTEEKTTTGQIEKQLINLVEYPEIKTFFQKNKFERFWTESIADAETFYIAFPEFILSNDYSKITSVRRQPTAKIRFKVMNEKTGLIEEVGLCHNWQKTTAWDDEYVAHIPVIDSYWSADQIKDYCKKNKIHKFVMPCFYPLMDETYYPKADWHAVFHNGWMEVANSIPKYKKHLFENQINIKYVVHISEEYFKRTYGDDWLDFTPDKKKQIRTQLADAIDNHLAGNENAGKSIQSVTYKDINGNWVKGIEVEAVDNKIKDGAYLPEASAANSEIMFALGVDPSLLGAGIPGGKMNTGSGSDKREAFSILTSLFRTKREIMLDIWRLIRDYNQWPSNLEGNFADIELTTLDVNATGTQTII